jgi:hypothetical protein
MRTDKPAEDVVAMIKNVVRLLNDLATKQAKSHRCHCKGTGARTSTFYQRIDKQYGSLC